MKNMIKLQNLKELGDFTGYAFVNTNSKDTVNLVSKGIWKFYKSDLINAALLTSKDGKLESVRGTIRFYNGEVAEDEDDTRNYEVIGSIKNGIIKLNHGWEFNEYFVV